VVAKGEGGAARIVRRQNSRCGERESAAATVAWGDGIDAASKRTWEATIRGGRQGPSADYRRQAVGRNSRAQA